MRFRRNLHDSDSEDKKVGSEYGREALILHEAVRMRYIMYEGYRAVSIQEGR
jgi:hypothetical protein